MKQHVILILLAAFLLTACNTTIPTIFGKRSPHEQYGQSLVKAGLNTTTLGKSWFAEAGRSLANPLTVSIPHKETGFFPAEKIRATAIQFNVKRGEKLNITLDKRPAENFTIYIDLWEVKSNSNKKLLSYADTVANSFNYEIDNDGQYLLRLQPELLSEGEYTLTILNGPSLAFPVKNGKMGSFWGADRDAGIRQHEGVDIFAPKRTPALAAANGTIGRVTDNKLGGKVVFLRPAGKNYNLYYAHLDEQLVTAGQTVKEGDTIGLVGNTGNAISTSPHLHFGIYIFGGAIDPLPFINPVIPKPAPITAAVSNVGKYMRNPRSLNIRDDLKGTGSFEELPVNTLFEVVSATNKYYKVLLPNGRYGFVNAASVAGASAPVKSIVLRNNASLFNAPDLTAARKISLGPGDKVDLLGNFENFYYVKFEDLRGWISKSL